MGCFMGLRGRKKKCVELPTNQAQSEGRRTLTRPSTTRFQDIRPQPLPLPLPVPSYNSTFNMISERRRNLPGSGLINFSFEEIASACNNFSLDRCMSQTLSSLNYRASFWEDPKLEASVTRLHPSNQVLKEFVYDVNTVSSLQHPSLCKMIGFHAKEGSENRMLVYERLYRGSLDGLVNGRSDGPSIDWNSRMNVILCAALGLSFLHEEASFQAMFHDFSTANIQVDKDFSAKLSGYGCICHISDTHISSYSPAWANLSVETLEKGLLTPKRHVYSFGIVLLELLTGRKNLDSRRPKEERNLVKWSRPFLAVDGRLSLIVDPRLNGRFPANAALAVADVAQLCLQVDPFVRPTMRTVVDRLKTIQEMKYYTPRFPLQEPEAIRRKYMSRSYSTATNGIIASGTRTN